MAAIYFEASNEVNKLSDPDTIPADAQFFNAKSYSGYFRLIVESSVIASRVNLFSIESSSYTVNFFIENGFFKVVALNNGSQIMGITCSQQVPADVITEIAWCVDFPNNNNYLLSSVFINGVSGAISSIWGSRHYPLNGNTRIMLGGGHGLNDGAKGLLINDFILAEVANHTATPIITSSTYRAVWKSNFNDSADPYKITVIKNSITTELQWSEVDTGGIIWTDTAEIPSGGGDTGGIIIPGNGNTTRIQGSIKEDDQPVARRVFAITQAQLEVAGSEETKHAVLSSVLSDENNGSYSLDTSPYEGEVLLLAMDDFGQVWQADTAYAVGDVIRPPTFQGYVYLCTSGGTTDSTEPTWWFDTEQGYAIGTAQFKAKPYNRPLAHGPILPEIIPES